MYSPLPMEWHNVILSIVNLNLFMGYLCLVLSLLMMLSFNSFFLFWIMLEFNMVLFLVVIYFSFNSNLSCSQESLFYLFIQSLGSFIFLSSSVLFSYLHDFFYSALLLLSLSLKTGLFPFHSWFFKISEHMNYSTFFFLLTLQKVPLLFLLLSNPSDFILLLLLVNSSFGSLAMLYSKTLVKLLISSSLYSLIWLFITYFSSFSLFSFSYFLYSFSIYIVLRCFANNSFINFSCNLFVFQFLAFSCGLPPFSLFFIKYFSFLDSFPAISTLILVIFWVVTFIGLMGYLVFLFVSITNFLDLMKKNNVICFSFFKFMSFLLIGVAFLF